MECRLRRPIPHGGHPRVRQSSFINVTEHLDAHHMQPCSQAGLAWFSEAHSALAIAAMANQIYAWIPSQSGLFPSKPLLVTQAAAAGRQAVRGAGLVPGAGAAGRLRPAPALGLCAAPLLLVRQLTHILLVVRALDSSSHGTISHQRSFMPCRVKLCEVCRLNSDGETNTTYFKNTTSFIMLLGSCLTKGRLIV